MTAPVLLFDLDGTLTDPRAGLVRCLRLALERVGAAAPSDDVLATFIGPPLRDTFATLLGTAEPAAVEEAIRLYRAEYGATGLYENAVYAGVPEMLVACRPAAAATFVATSKFVAYARRIVDHFGLTPHFDRVYGAGAGGRHDDKAELLAHLLREERVPAGAAVMIGDRSADVRGARLNGVASIGVLWGYGSREELEAAGADLLCEDPAQLAACLPRLAAARR